MHDVRFHVPTPVARAIDLRTSPHYPNAPADSAAPIDVTDLAWTNVTAVECSAGTARLITADILRARAQADDASFRASCTSAIDAIEMAIIDSAPRLSKPDRDRPGDMKTLTRPDAARDALRDGANDATPER